MTISTEYSISWGNEQGLHGSDSPPCFINGLIPLQSMLTICIVSLVAICGRVDAQHVEKSRNRNNNEKKLVDTVVVIPPVERDTSAAILSPSLSNTDTSSNSLPLPVRKHSPTKAAVFSALLPGMGQAYNKKYWKIPIVYAGFAGLGYWISHNVNNYRTYREAYRIRIDDDSLTVDSFIDTYTTADLKTLKDFYRRNLDLSVILTAVWYGLNIIDAAVDAHLLQFDVSDNLSIRIEPTWLYESRINQFSGMRLQLMLK